MIRALTLFLGLLVAGCISAKAPQTHSWSGIGMDNLILDLKDPKIIETYYFGPNGVVAATFGEKNGWITAPVFFWKTRGNLLFIRDETGKPVERLRLIEQKPSTLIVERHDGTEAIFAIKRK